VTQFVARSHPYPKHTSAASVSVSAKTRAECVAGLAAALQLAAATGLNGTAGELCDGNGLSWGCDEKGGTTRLNCNAYEGDPAEMQAQLQPLVRWAAAQGGTMHASISGRVTWNASQHPYNPKNKTGGLPPGLLQKHPDREISTALLASMSKYLPASYMVDDANAAALAEALVAMKSMLPSGQLGTIPMMGAKGQAPRPATPSLPPQPPSQRTPSPPSPQAGLDAATAAEFRQTSQNPVLLDAVGLWLIMYNIPSLPQVPVSSRLLQTMWPRLQVYAIQNHSDPLWATCDAGAAGNETAAVDCMATWHARIPALQA
jgi:hypothetical protein